MQQQKSQKKLKPKYANPLFKIKPIFYWRRLLYIFSGVILIGILMTLFISAKIRSSQYSIHTVVYSGNIRVTDTALTAFINSRLKGNILLGLLPKKNYFILPKHQLAQSIKKEFGFSSVSIDVIGKARTMHVMIIEQTGQYYVIYTTTAYRVSSSGMLLEEIAIPNKVDPNVFTIALNGQEKPNENKEIDKQFFVAVQEIQKFSGWPDTIHTIGCEAITDTSTDIIVRLNQTWYVQVDRSENITEQLHNAVLVYKNISNNTKIPQFSYIDVRIPGKAYYK